MSLMTREMELVNKLGLHARAAAKFVNTASGFAADVKVRRGEREVDGKSIMGILSLAAPFGTVLEVVTDGDDAEAALDALAALIADRFDEGE